MRKAGIFCFFFLLALAIPGSRASSQESTADCAARGKLQFVCGPVNAEDFINVPGTREILVSGQANPDMAAGKLYSVNSITMRYVELRPAIAERPAPEYAACPGPIDLAGFKPHGIGLRRGAGTKHVLYVVNHGLRESIEVFEVDSARYPSALKWTGCVVLPDGTSGNGVAPLPDGGFVATKFFDVSQGPFLPQLERGQKTGAVFAWHPKSGFTEIKAGRGTGDNGIEATADGRWIFVNIWPERRVLRIAADGKQPPSSIPLDFMPDNIHLAPDGSMLVGGHIADIHILANAKAPNFPVDWAVARVDPNTLKVQYLLWEKGFPQFQGVTGAIEMGGKLWLSTFRGDRLGVTPLPSGPL